MKILALRFAFLLLVLVLPRPLWAGEIAASSAVTAVTVFSDRALVTRSAEVSVPRGESTVVLDGLPAYLIQDSLRVTGEAAGEVLIGSVESRRIFSEQLVQEEERRLKQELEGFQDQRRVLEDRVKALNIQLKFIEAIGREMPKTADGEIVRGDMAPETWQKAWMALGKGAEEIYQKIRDAELAQRELDRKIEKIMRELSQVRTGVKEKVQARIMVEAVDAGPLRLEVSYQVPGASWSPLYDARLDGEAEKITLVHLGQVHQRTGEDWSGVALTLSTARPAEGAQMPEPGTWFVDFDRPRSLTEQGVMADIAVEEERALKSSPMAPALMQPAEAVSRKARVVAGDFFAEYRIAGASRVPSDGEPHKFTIGEHRLDGTLAVRTVPKVAPRAYLYAEMKYEGEAPLPPGGVSVYRDGAFIGRSYLERLRPGEDLKLSFGVDDRVRVAYRLQEDQRSQLGMLSRQQRVERRYQLTVENYHDRQMSVTVLDQLPVPRDERIKVELLKDATPPTAQDWEEKKGVLAWQASYQPKEKQVIRFGYAVAYPEGENVAGF